MLEFMVEPVVNQNNSSLWNDSLLQMSFVVPVVLQPKIAVFPLRKGISRHMQNK